MVSEEFAPGADALISRFVQRSKEMQRAAEVQRAALEEAEGWARKGPVEITLSPQGTLRTIVFDDDPDTVGVAALTNFTRQALSEASERANRATASSVIDPGARSAVLDSVPAEVAEQRDPDEAPVGGPEAPAFEGDFTVDELPPDPEFDALLDDIFDADDPLEALHAKAEAGEVPKLPEVEAGENLDDAIRRDIATTVQRLQEATAELTHVQATAELDEVIATVGAWGNLVGIEFRAPATKRSPEELASDVMRAIQQATEDANAQVRALMAGTEYEDLDVTNVMMRNEEQQR